MKRIAIAVLTLVMIFSFVACEATTVQPWYGKMVTNVTVASAPAYFDGETINPADITLNIQYDNGSATVNGVEAGLLPATDSKTGYAVQAGSTKLNLQYGYDRKGEVLLWDVYVPTVKATGLTVTASNVPTTTFASEAEAQKALENCLSFTLSYKGGSKAVTGEVANKNVPMTMEKTVVKAADGKTEQITYSLKETSTNNLPVTFTPVTVTVSTVDETKVIDAESFVITQDAEQEFYAVNGKWRATHDGTLDTDVATLADVDFTVSAKTLSGEKVDFNVVDSPLSDSSKDKDAYVDFDDYALTQKLNDSKLGNFAVTITYMYNGEKETAKATFNFKYTEDYVTKFSVKAPTAPYNPGDEIKEQNFTFTAVDWASGEKYENNSSKNSLSSSQFEIEPNYVPYGYWLDSSAKETIEITDITPDATDPEVKYAVLDETSKVSITVKKPASEA